MVEGKIRVEITNTNGICYKETYGNISTKQVFEETCVCDKDKRKKIAPYGVHVVFSVYHYPNDEQRKQYKDNFDIRVSRRYFDLDMSGCYVAAFEINSKIFHLFVNFDEDDATLSELYNDKYDGLVDTNYYNGNGLVSFEIVEE